MAVMQRFAFALSAGLLILAGKPATASAGTSKCTVGRLLELKTTMERMMPMVSVGINGHQERFLVDSGAFFSNISSGKASELGLNREPLPFGFRVKGIGGEVTPYATRVKDVDLAGVPLHNIQFLVGGSEVGDGAGLLGQNVLGIGDVEYDLPHGAIRLMRPKDCGNANLAYWAGKMPVSVVSIEPRDEHQRHTIGAVTVNGVKMRAYFDTGAGSTVLSLAAAKRIGLTPDSPDVKRVGYGHGVGSHLVASYIVPIDSIAIGDGEKIQRTHLYVEAMDLDTDMLIGADFFRSHRVYVANGLHKLFFTYDGGPIFSTGPTTHVDSEGRTVAVADDNAAEPTDAEGYSRRGAASLARHDLPHAIADINKAVSIAPTEPRYLFQRAQALAAGRQPQLAMGDLDHALQLDPGNAEARLMRASLRLGRRDRAAAEEDIAAVDKGAAPAADARLTLGGMYDSLDQFGAALTQYDLWLRYHGDDSRRAVALNGRCWVRAQLGTDLGKALSDCDGAVKARPDNASYLDSRGLVRLRMGDNERAIRDYDASLALAPRSAWSLYGRGLAKQHLGQKDAGQKDIDAAVAINAQLPERAKKLGIS